MGRVNLYGHLVLWEKELRQERRGDAVEVRSVETGITIRDYLSRTQTQWRDVGQVLEL